MIIAASKMYAERSAGRRVPVFFRVGAPKRDPLGSVSCRVHLRGIDPPRTIHGEDAMQALALAFAFIHMRVRDLQADGWAFYFGARDRDAFDLLSAWFPNWSEPERQRSIKRRRAERKRPQGR